MRKQILIIASAAALTAISCSKDKALGVVGDGYIHAQSTILEGVGSRVSESEGSNLTDFGFVHKYSVTPIGPGGTIDFSGATPINGSREAGADSHIVFDAANRPKYDKASGATSYLMGYRPAVTPASGVVSWPITGDVDVMVSNLWSAGTYAASIRNGLEFNHALALLHVKCLAGPGVGDGMINLGWGKIAKIEIKDAFSHFTLDHRNQKLAPGGTRKNIALFHNAVCSADIGAGVPITIQPDNGTNVDASIMIAPMDGTTLTLIVTTEQQDIFEVPVKIAAPATGLEGGKKHSINLRFNYPDKVITSENATIMEWIENQGEDISVIRPTIMEFNVAPNGSIIHPGMTAFTGSYMDLYGENGTNGAYRNTEQEAYTNELPYVKLEVAKNFIDMSYNDFNTCNGGNLESKVPNSCRNQLGSGWRIPRLSELKMIILNLAALEKTDLFKPFLFSSTNPDGLSMDSYIISATEMDSNNVWAYHWYVDHFNNIKEFGHHPKTGWQEPPVQKMVIRCVREIR